MKQPLTCLSPENNIHVIFVDSPYPQPGNAIGENNVPLCRVSDNACKVACFFYCIFFSANYISIMTLYNRSMYADLFNIKSSILHGICIEKNLCYIINGK